MCLTVVLLYSRPWGLYKEWPLRRYDEIQESTNDIMGVAVAFLIVQLIQVAAVGTLPDYHGEQAPNTTDFLYYRPGFSNFGSMAVICIGLFIFACLMLRYNDGGATIFASSRLRTQ